MTLVMLALLTTKSVGVRVEAEADADAEAEIFKKAFWQKTKDGVTRGQAVKTNLKVAAEATQAVPKVMRAGAELWDGAMEMADTARDMYELYQKLDDMF